MSNLLLTNYEEERSTQLIRVELFDSETAKSPVDIAYLDPHGSDTTVGAIYDAIVAPNAPDKRSAAQALSLQAQDTLVVPGDCVVFCYVKKGDAL